MQPTKTSTERQIITDFNTYHESFTANPDNLPYRESLEALTPEQRGVVAVLNLHGQVLNGGFSQWFSNGYHQDDMRFLLAVVEGLPGEEMMPVVRHLIHQADRVIVSNDDYDPAGRSISDEGYELLNELDSAYYAVSDQFEVFFALHLTPAK
ncbi:DUF4375 domain-containing protein [Deinococcus sp.]|uniref:DMP19 family protein n=1 Tax=Deinococcus sp. TaxID=47478 RepID=UPI0025DF537F|nr:DUF4375 domain-containing protein [Deinococcus sp.]